MLTHFVCFLIPYEVVMSQSWSMEKIDEEQIIINETTRRKRVIEF